MAEVAHDPELEQVENFVNSRTPKKYGTKKRKKQEISNAHRITEAEVKEAAELERILFGEGADRVKLFGKELEIESKDGDLENDETGFVIDKRGNKKGNDKKKKTENKPQIERVPAWNDEADASVSMNIADTVRLRRLRKSQTEQVLTGSEFVDRLRTTFKSFSQSTDWANLTPVKSSEANSEKPVSKDSEEEDDDDDDEDDDDEDKTADVLAQADRLILKSKGRLTPGILQFTRMNPVNKYNPCNAVIKSLEFHINGQLLLSAAMDKTLRFYNIDGKENPELQSVFLEDTPIIKASFTHDGSKVIASGRRPWYYLYDIAGGSVERISSMIGREDRSFESFEVSHDNKFIAFLGSAGHVNLVSQQSRQLITSLKLNGSVKTVTFGNEGKTLIAGGGDGEIYHWDLRTYRCFHRAKDDGSLRITSLSTSNDGRYLASGSDSGIVNVYDQKAYLNGSVKPLKALTNLTTEVDHLKFNHDGQMLAMSSRMKKDALRLVHLPSNTVFSNFPNSVSSLHYVNCFDFSPFGGYLSVGNAQGRIMLFRLCHYDHA